jgi:hypothetical protein
VLRGLPPKAAAGTEPKPQYALSRSLTARERAKAAELTAAGHRVTAGTVANRRRRYEKDGVMGLADHRPVRPWRETRPTWPPHTANCTKNSASTRRTSSWAPSSRSAARTTPSAAALLCAAVAVVLPVPAHLLNTLDLDLDLENVVLTTDAPRTQHGHVIYPRPRPPS